LNTFLVQWTNNELHRSWFTSFTIPPQGEAKSTSLGSAHLHNDHYHIHNKESKLFLFVCGESGLLIVDSSGQKVFDIKHPCSDITSYEQACSALEWMKHEGNGTFKFALKRKWFERTVTLILDRLYWYHNSQGTITDENFKRARKYIKEINS
jgi:hypothetical protein